MTHKAFIILSHFLATYVALLQLKIWEEIMNKKILAATIASVLCVPLMAHAADAKKSNSPTIYGKVHVSYGTIETKKNGVTTVDNWQERSHASRVGVKGERDLGNGLSAVYKFEWQVNTEESLEDTGATNGTYDQIFERRNMYVGLKGGFGEFRVGRHDMPLKLAQGKFDQFGDTDADLKHAGDQDGENRKDNAVVYLGKSGNVGYSVAAVAGEESGANANDGPADTVSASVSYKSGPMYFAIAQDSHANAGNAESDSMTRFVSTYKFSKMQVGLLVQSGVEKANTAGNEEDWVGLSFNAKVGSKGKIKAQYIAVEDNETNKTEGTLMAVGYDYKFDKKTTGYVMYSNLEEEKSGAKTLESSFVGVGMVLKF